MQLEIKEGLRKSYEAFDDITAVLILPLKYRKRLQTTNSVEQLNQEIRPRERVIRIFPNNASVIRLIGALLMEQDEKWQTGRKYFDMDLIIPNHQKGFKEHYSNLSLFSI